MFPPPFSGLLQIFSFVQFDWLSLDCATGRNSFFSRVIVASLLPIILIAVIVASGVMRFVCAGRRSAADKTSPEVENGGGTVEERRARIFSSTAFWCLVLTYMVLPTVATLQFKALDCVTLKHDDSSILRADSLIDCRSDAFLEFRTATLLFIFVYQSIPLVWLCLLWRCREHLNPPIGDQPVESALLLRKRNPLIKHLKFLYSDYLPSHWYYEVVELYRRLFLIGVVPLLGEGSARASIGCFASLIMAIIAREQAPFVRRTTSTLLVVAQYQILAAYYAAFVILSGSLADFGLTDFALGLVLVLTNCFMFVLIGYWCTRQHLSEKEALRRKRVMLPKVEWAVGFSATKFSTTFRLLREEHISGAHCLCFHYCSRAAAERAVRQGLPASGGNGGVPCFHASLACGDGVSSDSGASGADSLVQELLSAGASTEAATANEGWTALILAVQNGHNAVLARLLRASAAPDLASLDGATPLMRASSAGNVAAVRSLLAAGADPRRSYDKGWTSLLLAARQGHEDVVRVLLEAGEGAWDADEEDDAVTSIMLAVGADTAATGVEGTGLRLQRVVHGILQRTKHGDG